MMTREEEKVSTSAIPCSFVLLHDPGEPVPHLFVCNGLKRAKCKAKMRRFRKFEKKRRVNLDLDELRQERGRNSSL